MVYSGLCPVGGRWSAGSLARRGSRALARSRHRLMLSLFMLRVNPQTGRNGRNELTAHCSLTCW